MFTKVINKGYSSDLANLKFDIKKESYRIYTGNTRLVKTIFNNVYYEAEYEFYCIELDEWNYEPKFSYKHNNWQRFDSNKKAQINTILNIIDAIKDNKEVHIFKSWNLDIPMTTIKYNYAENYDKNMVKLYNNNNKCIDLYLKGLTLLSVENNTVRLYISE